MTGKTILVTGGTGAIGSNLIKQLTTSQAYDKLVILDNNSSGHADNIQESENIVVVNGDICDEAVLEKAFSEGITHVYHLAANFANQNSVNYPVKDLTTNGLGVVKLLEKCVEHDVKKILYASSSCVYKPVVGAFSETSPIMLSTPYSITKMLSEYYVTFFNKYKGLPAVIVRYFSSYGPGDYPGQFRSVIPNFLWKATHNEPLIITGTGKETRPFTYIDDIVNGSIAAMDNSGDRIVKSYYTHPHEADDNLIYNIGTETTTEMIELAEKINALTGNTAGIEYVERRDWDEMPHRGVDASKAKKELNFDATISLDEGLQKTLEWFKSDAFNKGHIK
ncbi:MAG: UDP-glucose 4-epimerase [Candidatus Azotimanducaceae bacterium]|jgi:UDP-glucose 4-epimerase